MAGLYDLVKQHLPSIAEGNTAGFYRAILGGFDLNVDDFILAQRELAKLGVNFIDVNSGIMNHYIDGQVGLGRERERAYEDIRNILRVAKGRSEIPQEALTSLVLLD